ncbi:MAG: hypothetical protein OER87_16780, partial [Gammaproteobacteria bacterium]|nr:hypothetical protein [Gammaproteobacteria bacterium]
MYPGSATVRFALLQQRFHLPAQFIFLPLPGDGHRYIVDDSDSPRNLVVRDIVPAKFAYSVCVDIEVRVGFDPGGDLFARAPVGYAEDRNLRYAGMAEQDGFDFTWVNILATLLVDQMPMCSPRPKSSCSSPQASRSTLALNWQYVVFAAVAARPRPCARGSVDDGLEMFGYRRPEQRGFSASVVMAFRNCVH